MHLPISTELSGKEFDKRSMMGTRMETIHPRGGGKTGKPRKVGAKSPGGKTNRKSFLNGESRFERGNTIILEGAAR